MSIISIESAYLKNKDLGSKTIHFIISIFKAIFISLFVIILGFLALSAYSISKGCDPTLNIGFTYFNLNLKCPSNNN